MGWNAAKAARLRAKEIHEVYALGLGCDQCYDYKKWAILDFISQCDPTCETAEPNPCEIQTFDCGATATAIGGTSCSSVGAVLCAGEVTIEFNNLELEPYIITEVDTNGDSMFIPFKYFRVNGEVIIASNPPDYAGLFLTPANIEIESGQVLNIPEYLNSLQDVITFAPGSAPNRLKATMPYGTTFSLQTLYNTLQAAKADGVIINESGLQGVQTSSNGVYLTPEETTQLGGIYVNWERVYEVEQSKGSC